MPANLTMKLWVFLNATNLFCGFFVGGGQAQGPLQGNNSPAKYVRNAIYQKLAGPCVARHGRCELRYLIDSRVRFSDLSKKRLGLKHNMNHASFPPYIFIFLCRNLSLQQESKAWSVVKAPGSILIPRRVAELKQ